jgi:hypothetical protein
MVRTMNGNLTGNITVHLRGGTYSITSPLLFTNADSGTNGYSVIYCSYNNEVPTISGGVQVTGWTLDRGNVYRTSLTRSTKLRSLFVNPCIKGDGKDGTLRSQHKLRRGAVGLIASSSGTCDGRTIGPAAFEAGQWRCDRQDRGL